MDNVDRTLKKILAAPKFQKNCTLTITELNFREVAI